MLGAGFRVTNYGVGGTTLLKKADRPYWNTSAFAKASTSNAQIVVIMLGTNDAKRWQWPKLHGEYEGDYRALIEVFTGMPSKPAVHIMSPPPLYRDGVYGMLQSAINSDLQTLVPKIAKDNNLDAPVDLFALFEGECPIKYGTPGIASNATDVPCDWIGAGGKDGCHPNNEGYGRLAELVWQIIKRST